MIPTYLRIRNFMCYRGPIEIDFRGIRVACLSGDNGAGKSALLDCITWSLWGKARVNADRELLALGENEMEVDFGFILGEQEFRVSRRRAKAGSGPLNLDIQALDGEQWRPLSGASVRETQQTIDRLLRMDYETFINSAFILQGRADEFTNKTPRERKQVLGEILSLGDYDRYEEIARQTFRERDRRVRDIDDELTELDARLTKLPQYQAEVTALSQALVALMDRAESLRETFSTVDAQVQSLQFTASRRDMVRAQIMTARQSLGEIEEQQRKLRKRVEEHRAIIGRRNEIIARHDELARQRQRNDTLANMLAERQELAEQHRKIEQRVREATHRLESEIHSVSCQIGERETKLKERPALTVRISSNQAEISRLDGLPETIQQLRQQQSERQARRGELQAENKRLKADMEAIKGRIDEVTGAEAICPVCRRALSDDERTRLTAEYTAEGTDLGNQYRTNRREMEQLQQEFTQAAGKLEELERQLQRLNGLQRTAATLAEQLRQVEQAEAETATLTGHLEALRKSLNGGGPVAELRPELARIEERLGALAYDRAEHQAIQRRIGELADVEQQRRLLETAESALEWDESQAAALTTQAERTRQEIEQAEAQEAELTAELGDLEPIRAERDRLKAELETIERERGETQERSGAAQQRLNDCLALQDRRDDLTGERRRAAEEKMIYDELMLAFGKKGIQTMIIENVLPDLQDEANAILDKMPGNTMRIEFRTQRQTLKGEGTIETLDIIISDEAGRRAYELYSGGEAFRANFAIRVALSMLLARRAGTRLQTLVIDEGFGTQDSRGRDGLIEAIRAVETEFQLILVITHITELKEMFPTRIDVVKTAAGSLVEVR